MHLFLLFFLKNPDRPKGFPLTLKGWVSRILNVYSATAHPGAE